MHAGQRASPTGLGCRGGWGSLQMRANELRCLQAASTRPCATPRLGRVQHSPCANAPRSCSVHRSALAAPKPVARTAPTILQFPLAGDRLCRVGLRRQCSWIGASAAHLRRVTPQRCHASGAGSCPWRATVMWHFCCFEASPCSSQSLCPVAQNCPRSDAPAYTCGNNGCAGVQG